MPSKEYRKFFEKLSRRRLLPKEVPIEEMRTLFEQWMANYPPPSDVRFEPFSIGPLPACWALARGVTRQRILLYFHGGGYTIGSTRSHWGIMGRLSQASGYAVLGMNYRLAPESPYPAAIEDALTAYQWLLHHPYPHNHIAFGGDSAGGGLALALLLKLKAEQRPMPAAAVCMSPWVDVGMTDYTEKKDVIQAQRTIDSGKAYYGDRDPKDPFISPLYGDLHGLPPLLIQAGAGEILFDQIVHFAEKAKKSGVSVTLEKWPDMIHCWQLFATEIPEGQEAIDRIGNFLLNSFPLPVQ